MFEPAITALRTLTIIPVPGRHSDNPAASLPFFPVIGGVIGAVLYGIAKGSVVVFPGEPLICGLLVTAVAIVITGALHIDGCADIADAFGGGRTREQVLAILKDSRHGTFGVTTIVVVVAGRILLTAWCIDHRHYGLLLISTVFSRTMQAWGCSLLPYALPEGGGTSVFFTGAHRTGLAVVSLAAATIAGWGIGPVALAVPVLLSLVWVLLFFMFCMKRIGGLTGDGLGAVNEIAELGILFTGAVFFSLPW